MEVASLTDAQITISADTDNSGEGDNPTLLLRQDGAVVEGLFGINGNAGTRYTNAIDNATFIESKGIAGTAVQIVTGDASAGGTEGTARLTVIANGNVGIGTTAPDNRLHIFESNNLMDATAGMTIEQAGTGDAVLHFENPGEIYTIGVDQLDDFFIISPNGSLTPGSDDIFIMNSVGRIAMGEAPPDADAILTLQHTSLGFIEPRMTSTQRDAITTPSTGLRVYNTSTNIPNYYNGTRWTSQADPTNVIAITSQADWDALVSGGTLTVAANTTLMLRTTITTDAEIVINTGISFSILGSRISTAGIFYTDTLTFITSDGTAFLRIDGINNLDGGGDGQLLDITNSSVFVEMSNSGVFNWDDLGSITNSSQFRILSVGYFFNEAGFFIDNVATTFISGTVLANGADMSDSYFDIRSSQFNDIAVTVSGNDATLQPNESLLQIDPEIGDLSTVVVDDNLLSGDNKTLFNGGGISGTFTAVTDASVAATTITGVTDSSGVARFSFTVGPTLFVNQQIVNSTFSQSTYNGTFIITTVGVGFFEVASIAFVAGDTGSFLSDSVIMSDPNTILVDGDTLVIDTDLSTDYDGGAIVYNQQTSSFRINRPFTVTKTGDWNTDGLNQKDPRVLATLNPGIISSTYEFSGFVNDNTVLIAGGSITNNTFRTMDFGTLVQSSTTERFKLIDATTGTFEYTGNEDKILTMPIDITGLSSGGAQEFRYLWHVDKTKSGTFLPIDDANEMMTEIAAIAQAASGHSTSLAQKGFRFRPQFTRTSGSSGLTTRYATLSATGQ